MNEQVISSGRPVIQELPETRQKFLNKTYHHLLGAILLLIGIETVFFKTGIAESIFVLTQKVPWLIILGIFMFLSHVVSNFAYSSNSKSTQYLALGGYVLLWAIILVPLLYMAIYRAEAGLLEKAAITTVISFAILTGIVMFSGKDFSFLRSFMIWGGVVAIVAIVGASLFGFQLGMFFVVAMLAYSGGAVLYTTDRVLKHYPEEYYVGAALALFSSIAMLFWYVAQFFMAGE